MTLTPGSSGWCCRRVSSSPYTHPVAHALPTIYSDPTRLWASKWGRDGIAAFPWAECVALPPAPRPCHGKRALQPGRVLVCAIAPQEVV
mgnify:FL=1